MLKRTGVLIPVGIAIAPLTMLLILYPVASVFAAVRTAQGALPMPNARFEATDICLTLRRRQGALTLKKTIFQSAGISVPIRKDIATLPVGFASPKSSAVNVTRKRALQTPSQPALTIKAIVLKVPNVLAAIEVCISAFPGLQISLKFANVRIAIGVRVDPINCLLTI